MKLKRLVALSTFLLLSPTPFAQYQQSFDTISAVGTSTYTNLPEGWAILEVGTGTAADGKYLVNSRFRIWWQHLSFDGEGLLQTAAHSDRG